MFRRITVPDLALHCNPICYGSLPTRWRHNKVIKVSEYLLEASQYPVEVSRRAMQYQYYANFVQFWMKTTFKLASGRFSFINRRNVCAPRIWGYSIQRLQNAIYKQKILVLLYLKCLNMATSKSVWNSTSGISLWASMNISRKERHINVRESLIASRTESKIESICNRKWLMSDLLKFVNIPFTNMQVQYPTPHRICVLFFHLSWLLNVCISSADMHAKIYGPLWWSLYPWNDFS